jgi:hypothetical protein
MGIVDAGPGMIYLKHQGRVEITAMSSSTLQTAIASVHSGDKETAQRLLEQVIRDDPQNATAWLWMSSVTDSDEHRRFCLEKVLKINPHNETAQRGLEALSQSEPSQAQKQLGLPLITAVTPLQHIRKLQDQAANATEQKRLTATSPRKKGALTLAIVLAIVTVAVLCVAFVLIASTA